MPVGIEHRSSRSPLHLASPVLSITEQPSSSEDTERAGIRIVRKSETIANQDGSIFTHVFETQTGDMWVISAPPPFLHTIQEDQQHFSTIIANKQITRRAPHAERPHERNLDLFRDSQNLQNFLGPMLFLPEGSDFSELKTNTEVELKPYGRADVIITGRKVVPIIEFGTDAIAKARDPEAYIEAISKQKLRKSDQVREHAAGLLELFRDIFPPEEIPQIYPFVAFYKRGEHTTWISIEHPLEHDANPLEHYYNTPQPITVFEAAPSALVAD